MLNEATKFVPDFVYRLDQSELQVDKTIFILSQYISSH